MMFKLIDHSSDVLSAFEMQVKRGLMVIGEVATGYAKEESPVDSGRLMNSIDHREDERSTYIGTNVEYAKYVEFNDKAHHRVGNAHFLRNAAANHSAEYKNIMETSLRS